MIDINIDVISSSYNLKSFIDSSAHTDYINELDIRILETNGLLEDPEMQYSGRQYDMFRGRIKNLREMKELFVSLYEIKLNEEESNDS